MKPQPNRMRLPTTTYFMAIGVMPSAVSFLNMRTAGSFLRSIAERITQLQESRFFAGAWIRSLLDKGSDSLTEMIKKISVPNASPRIYSEMIKYFGAKDPTPYDV